MIKKIKRSKLDKLITKLSVHGPEMNACDLFDLVMDIRDEQDKVNLAAVDKRKKQINEAVKKFRSKNKLDIKLTKNGKIRKRKSREDEDYKKFIDEHNLKFGEKDKAKESWKKFFDDEKTTKKRKKGYF